jgi:hypothetical protein
VHGPFHIIEDSAISNGRTVAGGSGAGEKIEGLGPWEAACLSIGVVLVSTNWKWGVGCGVVGRGSGYAGSRQWPLLATKPRQQMVCFACFAGVLLANNAVRCWRSQRVTAHADDESQRVRARVPSSEWTFPIHGYDREPTGFVTGNFGSRRRLGPGTGPPGSCAWAPGCV